MESLTSGTLAGTGSFRCEICGHVITMTAADVLPQCPGCDGASFTRASLFSTTGRFKRVEPTARTESGDAEIDAARDALDEPGRYLVFHDAGAVRTVTVPGNSMRIGRSLSAELRFEDPTVSRRHAIVVLRDGQAFLHDDNSLNGTWCNDERVGDGVALHDGDVIRVGAATLRYMA